MTVRSIYQVAFALVLGLVVSAQAAPWLDDFEQAKQEAKDKGRPILVDFSGSDWCGWCIKLDKEVFSTKTFTEYADKNLVLFLADFPRGKEQSPEVVKQNRELARKYGVRGFPTVLLLNAKGDVIAQTGYQEGGAEAYVEHIKTLLKNGG
jgi:thioredoxin-related protein